MSRGWAVRRLAQPDGRRRASAARPARRRGRRRPARCSASRAAQVSWISLPSYTPQPLRMRAIVFILCLPFASVGSPARRSHDGTPGPGLSIGGGDGARRRAPRPDLDSDRPRARFQPSGAGGDPRRYGRDRDDQQDRTAMTGKIAVGGITRIDGLVLIRILGARVEHGLAGRALSAPRSQGNQPDLRVVVPGPRGPEQSRFRHRRRGPGPDAGHPAVAAGRTAGAVDRGASAAARAISIYGPHFSERPAIAGTVFQATGRCRRSRST